MNKFLVACSLLLFFLFLSGVVIGVLVGSRTTQDRWLNYYELKEKQIAQYCYCSYPEGRELLNLTGVDTLRI